MGKNTLNQAPVFVSERPDWSKTVMVDRNHATTIFVSQNATEQRQRRRVSSKIGISFQLEAMTPPEAFAREVAILQELQSPVVIPVWPYKAVIVAQSGTTVTTLGLTGFPMRKGWVFIEDDNGESFYPVASWGSTSVVLTGTVPTFINGTLYPCIRGVRRDGSTIFMTTHTDTRETVAVDEL